MARKNRVHREHRVKLERQRAKLRQDDEAAFVARLKVAERVLPAEALGQGFRSLIRRLWTDGSRDASIDEWAESLPARWDRQFTRIGHFADGIEVQGEPTDPILKVIASVLVRAHDYDRYLESTLGDGDV